jgi:hypothetical protein
MKKCRQEMKRCRQDARTTKFLFKHEFLNNNYSNVSALQSCYDINVVYLAGI